VKDFSKRVFVKGKSGRNRPQVVVITEVKGKRRTVSPGMARAADLIEAEFGIPAERAGEPDFYLVDRLTGQPIIPRRKVK